ncbi:hypothetical protein [Pantoea dispersa]|uniref:hypothetical protein n=1 Tax=Pantoea dispersa TaxID=59814 RepID=UPI003D19D2DD
MNNPIPNLKLDVWYKVMISVCTIIFLATAAGLLPNLPTKETLLASLGALFLGLGKWKNHPRHTIVQEVWNRQYLGTGFKRKFSVTGTLLCLLGLYLLYKGLWHLI